jgi:hypothetical protein
LIASCYGDKKTTNYCSSLRFLSVTHFLIITNAIGSRKIVGELKTYVVIGIISAKHKEIRIPIKNLNQKKKKKKPESETEPMD